MHLGVVGTYIEGVGGPPDDSDAEPAVALIDVVCLGCEQKRLFRFPWAELQYVVNGCAIEGESLSWVFVSAGQDNGLGCVSHYLL